jgi:hypothetical protein
MIFSFLLLIILTDRCLAQSDSTLYFKDMGWTMHLPNDFKFTDSATKSANIDAGKKMMESAIGKPLDISHVVRLINASKNKFTSFISNYSSSTQLTADNWEPADSTTKNSIMVSINKQIPVKPVVINSIIRYDGVAFKKLDASYALKADVSFHFSILTTFRRNHYLIINYMYVDSASGKEILNILETSKFDRE